MTPLSLGGRQSDSRRPAGLLRRAAIAAGAGMALLPAILLAQDPTPTTPSPTTPTTPAPTPVAAQVAAPTSDYVRQFVITPRGGYIHYDRASSLKPGAAIGIDAQYHFTPSFSLGTNFTFSRSNTYGEDFLATLTYGLPSVGDTTFIFGVRQPISVVDVQVAGMFHAPTYGRFSPFVMGGGGVYVMYLDPDANRGSARIARPALSAGVGVDVRLSRIAGIRLDVRDQAYLNYDREKLRPTDARFRNSRVLEGYPLPPTPKSTINNFMVSLGFTFTPRGSDEQTGPREEDQ
jgi:hypothetical protein